MCFMRAPDPDTARADTFLHTVEQAFGLDGLTRKAGREPLLSLEEQRRQAREGWLTHRQRQVDQSRTTGEAEPPSPGLERDYGPEDHSEP
jgi:hypothetical protein